MKTTIRDMRPGYGTQIHLIDNQAIFNGSKISELLKDESDKRQKHLYTVIQFGTVVASIALTDQDFKAIDETLNPIDFTRVNSDGNGNSRFVCHFLAFISENDEFTSLDERYALALKRAKQFGGRKFHNKQYGGGIVFQMYECEAGKMSAKIREFVKTINPE